VSTWRPIADYALLADCCGVALVSRDGDVDWCCLPRVDSGSCFAAILDPDRGGRMMLRPQAGGRATRRYLERTMVLETTWEAETGRARVLDLLTLNAEDPADAHHELLRVVEGLEGEVVFELRVAPRFDYGTAAPWLRRGADGGWHAIAGDDALLISADGDLRRAREHELHGRLTARPGARAYVALRAHAPEKIDSGDPPRPHAPEELNRRLRETVDWWRAWAASAQLPDVDAEGVLRSAIAIKSLANARTGALAAAATTSLPESREGRTWDYRYSWVRDSVFAVRSLAELGLEECAEQFRRFVERSAAGSADELRTIYGIGGERRLPEIEIGALRGWNGIGPVRVGNAAAEQDQHDAFGQVVDLIWRWHERGSSPDEDLWRFVMSLVDRAEREWRAPDAGLWEFRAAPRHFTHSKVLCWVTFDRAIRMARDTGRDAPLERWEQVREEIRATIDERAWHVEVGAYTQAYGAEDLDAATLRMPAVGYRDWGDQRVLSTARVVRRELDAGGGLIRRYLGEDGQPGVEGAFLACTFWLAEVLARGGRREEAEEVFQAGLATRNDVGLFSEQYDPGAGEMLGNFPQALTHFSHIEAALALGSDDRRDPGYARGEPGTASS
jgi:GH15 family glucan-1,4-alpha-glucosidase